MCGILGTINHPFGNDILDLISHRGPDDSGIEIFNLGNNQVYFGHRRLSIIDLSPAGHQPMITDCGNYAIIFNGEIYNHLELRKQLKGINFKGHSDTETILYYLKHFGIDAVKNFNGIFAFAFLDKRQQKLFLVRDPFGVKPLYYAQFANKLIFSSELKTILKLLPERTLNVEHLYTFLRIRFSPAPQTLLQDVYKVEAGHYLEFDLNHLQKIKKNFFSYLPEKNVAITEQEALDKFDELLHKAVKRQLLADVPIAILLSGGVDSALLTYLAQKVSGEKFSTYTVGYDFQTDANELEDARISAQLLGSEHHEIVLTKNDFADHLHRFIGMVEEPIGSQSIFPFYYLTQKIHQDGFKVALTGQGVDEAWAGYNRYNTQQLFEKMAHPAFRYFQFMAGLSKNDKHRRAFNALSKTSRKERFIETYSFFDAAMTKQLTNDCFSEQHHQHLLDFFQEKFAVLQLQKFNSTDAMMFLDSRMNLSDDLLLYTDKISMQHSLELRVPFLDVELMQFTESLPIHYKVSLFHNKKIYKKLAERYLPKEIIYRKKKGFYIPRKEWFRNETGEKFRSILMEDKSMFFDIFNKKYIMHFFDEHKQGKKNYEDQLYSLLNIFYWFKQNFD